MPMLTVGSGIDAVSMIPLLELPTIAPTACSRPQ